MTFSVSQFRSDFPEFASATTFPDSMVTFWSGLGLNLISDTLFGVLYDQAIELFTAHNITMAAQNRAAVTAGSLPGATGGAIASKSIGSVSVSYNNQSVMLANAGHWNQTVYGRQYIQLVRMVSPGVMQL